MRTAAYSVFVPMLLLTSCNSAEKQSGNPTMEQGPVILECDGTETIVDLVPKVRQTSSKEKRITLQIDAPSKKIALWNEKSFTAWPVDKMELSNDRFAYSYEVKNKEDIEVARAIVLERATGAIEMDLTAHVRLEKYGRVAAFTNGFQGTCKAVAKPSENKF